MPNLYAIIWSMEHKMRNHEASSHSSFPYIDCHTSFSILKCFVLFCFKHLRRNSEACHQWQQTLHSASASTSNLCWFLENSHLQNLYLVHTELMYDFKRLVHTNCLKKVLLFGYWHCGSMDRFLFDQLLYMPKCAIYIRTYCCGTFIYPPWPIIYSHWQKRWFSFHKKVKYIYILYK